MPRTTKPLTDTQIKSARPKQKDFSLYDGDGLRVLVKVNGVKSWRFDYTRPFVKKRNTLSLGSYPELSLSDARNIRS